MNETLTAPRPEVLPPTHEIVVPGPKTLEAMFEKPDEITKLLAKLREAARAHKPDLSTDKGRKAIASVARKVSSSKVALDDAGKALTEERRRAIDAVNAERSKIRAFLDDLRDEVRKPLTDWEAAEKARVEALQARVTETFAVPAAGASAAELRQRLEEIEAVELDDSWAEYIGDAERAKLQAVMMLRPALAAAEKAEADAAELKKLRAQAKKLEEAEAKEKAEKDRLAAEEAERQRLAQIEEDKRLAGEQAAKREREAAEIRAQSEREAAEQREAMLKQQAENAAAAERKRIEDEQRAADEERRKREQDQSIRTLARGKIVKALVEPAGPLSKSDALDVADFIIAGRVPHVRFEP